MAIIATKGFITPTLILQSYEAVRRDSTNVVSGTDDDKQSLLQIVIPGRTMNLNGELRIHPTWSYTNSANTKNLYVDWNGSNVSWVIGTTTEMAYYQIVIKNMNSLVSQTLLNHSTYGTSTAASGSANTANNVTIDFGCKWNTNVSGEHITLLGYSVWYYPGTT